MRSTVKESILSHSADVAIYAQALAVIANTEFGKSVNVDRVGTLALYHDVSEVITGDLATPVKYFNEEILSAYKKLEKAAEDKLLSMLPDNMRAEYASYLSPDASTYEYRLVKAADKLSAYIKCIEELSTGNREFSVAKDTLEKNLRDLHCPEVDYFLDNLLDGFGKPLDVLDQTE